MLPNHYMLAKMQTYTETQLTFRAQNKLHARLKCCRMPIINEGNPTGRVEVSVTTHKDGSKRGRYVGVAHCGSTWSCPVCTPFKIMVYREKLTAAIERKASQGWIAVMVTLTVPHYHFQPARAVLNNMLVAKHQWDSWLKTQWRWNKLKFTVNGSITATEATFSRAFGWHFHQHVVYFIRKWQFKLFLEFEETARAKWAEIIAPLKKFDSEQLGLVFSKHIVKNGEYLAKEMAKNPNQKKRDEYSGLNVFELLESNDARDIGLFLEYARATAGKSRIRCSKGVMQGIDIDEVKKKALAQTETLSDETVAVFPLKAWIDINECEHESGIPHRANILVAAANGGYPAVYEYCLEYALRLPARPWYTIKPDYGLPYYSEEIQEE